MSHALLCCCCCHCFHVQKVALLPGAPHHPLHGPEAFRLGGGCACLGKWRWLWLRRLVLTECVLVSNKLYLPPQMNSSQAAGIHITSTINPRPAVSFTRSHQTSAAPPHQQAQREYGNKWRTIVDGYLPWRSPNDLKNYCNQYINGKRTHVSACCQCVCATVTGWTAGCGEVLQLTLCYGLLCCGNMRGVLCCGLPLIHSASTCAQSPIVHSFLSVLSSCFSVLPTLSTNIQTHNRSSLRTSWCCRTSRCRRCWLIHPRRCRSAGTRSNSCG